MTKRLILSAMILILVVWVVGCEKETTTTSSEYHEIVGQSGTDTVYIADTVIINDPNGTTVYDTTIIIDTIIQNNSQVDTVIQYVTQIDTVYSQTAAPSVHAAFTAMQAYTDQIVIDDITATVGYTDGWVFYLSAYQSYVDNPATNVWDFGGYIDFWAPDFSDFYAYEYGWRMSYTSGDPNDPNNWQMSEIPAGSPAGRSGLKKVDKTEPRQSIR